MSQKLSPICTQNSKCLLNCNPEVSDAGHVVHVGDEGVLAAALLQHLEKAGVQEGLVEVAVSGRVPPEKIVNLPV